MRPAAEKRKNPAGYCGLGGTGVTCPIGLGSDLGRGYEESFVLEPGTVVVFEPVIWDEGAAGYRAEEMVVVTDDGWMALGGAPFDPFGGCA